MDQPAHRHRQDRAQQQHRDDDRDTLPTPGELSEELLAQAVVAALKQGASWAQIGAHLGVPDPCAPPHGGCSDLQWQNAIVEHQNARAQRIHPTDMPAPRTTES
ncbi:MULTISPECIES: hypothetical protein [Rhodococcus]|uniref:hypothetical protein n=1 Tax=Rhodococcus TaxID=1827 RepID=UPI001EF018EA|nr:MULTISPECIES: hypothetical protein [Rhodococcus]UOT08137.1 hypothetical protein MPY17_37920 [Rhodococcus opacus]